MYQAALQTSSSGASGSWSLTWDCSASPRNYNYKRYYQPGTGRYLGVDPARADATGYTYVHSHPLLYVDPVGDIAFLGAAFLVIEVAGLAYSAYDLATFINEQYQQVHAGKICEDQAIKNVVMRIGLDAALTAAGVGVSKLMASALRAVFRGGIRASRNVQRVFYSGKGARVAAERYAQEHGAVTLEQTMLGATLEGITSARDFKYLEPVWRLASERFARGAKGSAHVFHANVVRIDAVFKNEYKVLTSQGNDIVFHLVP